MPVNNPTKNMTHRRVIKLIDGDCVKVTQEAWSDRVASTARRAHSSDQLNINQFHSCGILQVIPVIENVCTKCYENIINNNTSSNDQATVSVILLVAEHRTPLLLAY